MCVHEADWFLPSFPAVSSLMRTWQEAHCPLNLVKWAQYGLLKYNLRTWAHTLGPHCSTLTKTVFHYKQCFFQ